MSEGIKFRSKTKEKMEEEDQSGQSVHKLMADGDDVPEVLEFTVPNFTTFRSSLYIVQDMGVIGISAYLALHMDTLLLGTLDLEKTGTAYIISKLILWTVYTFITGLFGMGRWVIGHECGHQAFSSSKIVNNTVGWFIHSALLVPYHSWRITHGTHHAACGHSTRDEVFIPRTRKLRGIAPTSEKEVYDDIVSHGTHRTELQEALEESPIYTLSSVIKQQIFGFPAYLIANAGGQRHHPIGTNHFNPYSIIFRPDHFWQIIISTIGVLINIAILSYWSYKRSFSEMVIIYLIPYLWVNHWLVFIVYLQHTDPLLPHYSSNEWTSARGALATIDRTIMGPIGPYVFHGLCETHVAHHVCSKIPHYNAWEATEALKKFLGPHYHSSNESMFKAFWRSMRECIFVEENEDVVFYKNWKGTAVRQIVTLDNKSSEI